MGIASILLGIGTVAVVAVLCLPVPHPFEEDYGVFIVLLLGVLGGCAVCDDGRRLLCRSSEARRTRPARALFIGFAVTTVGAIFAQRLCFSGGLDPRKGWAVVALLGAGGLAVVASGALGFRDRRSEVGREREWFPRPLTSEQIPRGVRTAEHAATARQSSPPGASSAREHRVGEPLITPPPASWPGSTATPTAMHQAPARAIREPWHFGRLALVRWCRSHRRAALVASFAVLIAVLAVSVAFVLTPKHVTLTAAGLRVQATVEQVGTDAALLRGPDGRLRTVNLRTGYMTGSLYGQDDWRVDADDLDALRPRGRQTRPAPLPVEDPAAALRRLVRDAYDRDGARRRAEGIAEIGFTTYIERQATAFDADGQPRKAERLRSLLPTK